MKLLLDHNLSPRLVGNLSSLYPGTSHVSLVGLDRASDQDVWDFAKANDYVIVTKDSDFNDVAVMRGVPPKVLWLRLGNCTTRDVERALRESHELIGDFIREPAGAVLEIR